MTTLVIANKLYSSWSLRPWLLLRELGIAFDEVVVPLRQPDTNSRIRSYGLGNTVPTLVDDGATVWESLAIVEYAAERWPNAGVWPADREARALARSMAAEMHSGFGALRSACPMNLGKRFAERDRGPAVAKNVARIEEIWAEARSRYGTSGPFLFGRFSAADAMFAPVVIRLQGYGFAVTPESRAYMDAVLALPSFREWREAALRETWVVDDDEVDEEPVEIFRHVP